MIASRARSAAGRPDTCHASARPRTLAQARVTGGRRPARRAASQQEQPSASQQPSKQQQQQQHGHTAPGWQQQLAQRWEASTDPQRGYAVVVALLALAALPRVLTIAVLLLERVVVGALLATEELLLELLLKGGALVRAGARDSAANAGCAAGRTQPPPSACDMPHAQLGALAVVGVLVSGLVLFSRKESS